MTPTYVQHTLRLALILLSLGAARASAGTLTGMVTDPSGQSGLKDAVVWAKPIGPMPTFAPPTQHAEMVQANLAFVPRVLPVLVGTTVDFPNRDTVYHSIYSFARQQRFEIGLYKPGESRAVTFHQLGVVKLFCNIHDNMFGTILVVSTPYFSTTNHEGAFTIPDIPAGDYTVQIWHHRLEGRSQTVSVTAGGTAERTFVLHAKPRNKGSRK